MEIIGLKNTIEMKKHSVKVERAGDKTYTHEDLSRMHLKTTVKQ